MTAAGRRRLERRRQGYLAQIQRLQAPPVPDEEHDFSDQADALEAPDDSARVADQAAALEAILARAQPLAAGPADGAIRQGSTVLLRDAAGARQRFVLLDGVELETNPEEIALDSPLGRALLGHAAGDEVAVDLPAGERRFTIISVEPYRP